ncbi:MAG: bifunctional diguanylate cyclase/phosphodiesterase, partial [Pseudomonadota bacterium]
RPDILFGAVEHAIRSVAMERENENQRAELEYIGLHDHLTGLPNRKLFFDRLEQAMLLAERNASRFSVCSMDLNRFKQINDTLGHATGDAVIKESAERLKVTLRSSDTVARFGGDEFVALLDVPDNEDAVAVCDKLIDAIVKPIDVDDLQVGVGISIGISTYPKDGSTARELLKKADAAMYEAKRGSRGVVVYSEVHSADDQRSIAVATEISNIVDSDRLEMEYQPKIRLSDNRIIGAEALVRWRHPTLGLLPPVDFVPAVERTQKIKPMTLHIAELSIRQCASWREMGVEVPVAVNLSAKTLDSANLPAEIQYLLEKWSLPPEYLTLEVTETGALASHRVAADILYELSQQGIKISIDDFGSGYTSFRYLREFIVHELKIDRMFIDDLVKGKRDESIVRSMLELGKGFGVQVVAEGIEDQETLDKLKSLDCDCGQGYFFSHSMSANQFMLWASEWNIRHNLS